jgi:hypothetical protein
MGINLVLSGHDHNYQRFFIDGLSYVVSGFNAANRYAVTKSTALVAANAQQGYLMLEVDSYSIRGIAKYLNGTVIDTFALHA